MSHATIHPPTCADCGSPMVLRETRRFLYKNGDPRKFWGCSSYPNCRGIHGAHPDGRPLGIPGDAPTKAARVKAHDAFDKLWKGGRMSRKSAYQKLEDFLGVQREEAHIGAFNIEQCEKVQAWAKEISDALDLLCKP